MHVFVEHIYNNTQLTAITKALRHAR